MNARGVADGNPGRYAEQAGQRRHREGELLAVAALGLRQEANQGRWAGWLFHVQAVREAPAGQEPVLQQQRLLVKGRRAGGDSLGQRQEFLSIGRGEGEVLRDDAGLGGLGRFQLR